MRQLAIVPISAGPFEIGDLGCRVRMVVAEEIALDRQPDGTGRGRAIDLHFEIVGATDQRLLEILIGLGAIVSMRRYPFME